MKHKDRLTVVPAGGLANRMRAVASAIVLGHKLNWEVRIIWYKNQDLFSPFEAIFDSSTLPASIVSPNPLSYHIFFEPPRKKNLYLPSLFHKLGPHTYLYINRDVDNEEFAENLAGIKKDVIIYSGYEFADIDHTLIRSIFRFSERVNNRVEEILDGSIPDFALQIRRTDNSLSVSNSPIELFETILEEGLKKDGNVKYFLATDDQPTKLRLKEKYGEHLVTNPREASRTTVEGIIDAAAEMEIMSRCRQIYGSYWSSYSEMASLLGDTPLTVVRKEK